MLRIREFVRGRDEQRWVSILNAAYEKFRDWRTITTEEHFATESPPYHVFDRRWIAELDGRPVGTIRAFVQIENGRKKGYIDDLGVTPASSGLCIEEVLSELATNNLRGQDVDAILVPRLRWFSPQGGSRAEFLERLGFNLIRQTSLMEMDLPDNPPGVSGNKQVTMTPLRYDVDDNVRKLTWLRNECSKEQFNFRPYTAEEVRYFLQSSSYSWIRAFFATLNGEHVGLSVLAIDSKHNAEKHIKAGVILAIGVLKEHRKSGIGTSLVLHGLEAFRNEKMTKALLDVDDLNQTGAMRLYMKTGFRVVEKYLTYEKACS